MTANVSEQFLEVLSKIDSMEHQFEPIRISAESKAQFKKRYYCLNVRRYLEFGTYQGNDANSLKPKKMTFDVDEEKILPLIRTNEDLRKALEEFPIWKHPLVHEPVYINEKLFKELKVNNITGIEPNSVINGNVGEGLICLA